MAVIHNIEHLLHPVLAFYKAALFLNHIKTPECEKYIYRHAHRCRCCCNYKGSNSLIQIPAEKHEGNRALKFYLINHNLSTILSIFKAIVYMICQETIALKIERMVERL